MKKIIATTLSAIVSLSFMGAAVKTENGDLPAPLTGTAENINGGSVSLGAPNGYFVKDDKTEYKIVVPAEATATETYAANELKNYISETVNCNIVVVSDENKSFDTTDKVLSVGKTAYQKGAGLTDEDYENLNGGYLLKSFGTVYILDSDTKNGLIYSVYHFLTLFFGVEFLTLDYTYIPQNVHDVAAYSVNIKDVPTFPVRDFYSYPVWFKSQGDAARLGMNSPSFRTNEIFDAPFYYGYYYQYDGKTYNSTREGHSIESMLCVDAYRNGAIPSPSYKSTENGASQYYKYGYYGLHEDWYAYDPNYERTNSDGRSQEEFCYSNGLTADGDFDASDANSFTAKIVEICMNMIREETSENAYYLMLGHGDYYAQCKCGKCKENYKKYGDNFSGLYCVWANAVAKEVKKRMQAEGVNKQVKFVIFAYSKSLACPVTENADGSYTPIHPKIKLDDSVAIKMAYGECSSHALWNENCEANETQRTAFKQWSSLSNEFAIWDYVCNYKDYLWYMPDYGTLKENYEYYKSLNVKHQLSQGTPGEYNYYEYHLKCYVSLNLMWNVDQDVNALIEKFNNLYFGEKYAPYVNLYRDIFENHAAILDYERKDDGGYHATTGDNRNMKSADNYSREMLEAAIGAIDKAIALANADTDLTGEEKETLILRLRSVKVTPQYMLLRLGYVINENELKLIAADFFESVEKLKLTYVREGSNVANSFDQMKQSYGL